MKGIKVVGWWWVDGGDDGNEGDAELIITLAVLMTIRLWW